MSIDSAKQRNAARLSERQKHLCWTNKSPITTAAKTPLHNIMAYQITYNILRVVDDVGVVEVVAAVFVVDLVEAIS